MKLKVAYGRIYRILKILFWRMLSFIVLISMVIIRPYKIVMLGELRDRTIGDLYMRYTSSVFLLQASPLKKKFTTFWFFGGPKCANLQANTNFQRAEKVLRGPLWKEIWRLAHKQRVFYPHIIPHIEYDSGTVLPVKSKLDRDFYSRIDQSVLTIPKTNNSHEKFKRLLQQLGVNEYAGVVCLNIRNSDYKEFHLPIRDGMGTLKLEKILKAQNHRNSSIENFGPAISCLTSLGYVVIRLGMPEKFDTSNFGSGYINYGNTNFCTPENDLLLMENSEYLISTVSGPMEVARSFKKIVLALDVGSLDVFNQSYLSSHTIPIVLPKVILEKKSGNPISISALKSSGLLEMNHREVSRFFLESETWTLVSNSKEAIRKTVELFFYNSQRNSQHPALELGKRAYAETFGTICCKSCTPCLSPYWINSRE